MFIKLPVFPDKQRIHTPNIHVFRSQLNVILNTFIVILSHVNDVVYLPFQIFIGRIPRDCSLEKELVPLFEKAGHLFEFRLMVQFSGCNRGSVSLLLLYKVNKQCASSFGVPAN